MKLSKLHLRRTTVLAFGCLAVLLGLALSRKMQVGPMFVAVLLVGSMVVARRKNIVALVAFLVLCTSLGLWRGSVFMQKTAIYARLSKSPVIISGIADSDSVYAEKSQISFDLKDVHVYDPINQKLVGGIRVKGYGEPMVYKGDIVQVEGKMYPTRGAKQASIGFADITVVKRGVSLIDEVRRRFASGLLSALPEPLGSFGLGLLVGQRSTLPKEFTAQLSAVGLSHIVAVSGYNVTIIILLTRQLLSKRSKYQTTLLTVCLALLFVAFTGNSASIVRAMIVSMLSLLAWFYGRVFKPWLLIALTAAITAFWNPIYLWSDLGWWLSFLAFAGVLIVAPIVLARLYSKKPPKMVASLVVETLSAQVMTAPLIMYTFGTFSLVAVLANIVVVPLVPLAMLLCFVAGLAGAYSPVIAGWFTWPARMIMSYMVDIVRVFSKLPNAMVDSRLLLWQMALLYVFLCATILIGWKKVSKKGKITDRNKHLAQLAGEV